jgi:hypothetical protein
MITLITPTLLLFQFRVTPLLRFAGYGRHAIAAISRHAEKMIFSSPDAIDLRCLPRHDDVSRRHFRLSRRRASFRLSPPRFFIFAIAADISLLDCHAAISLSPPRFAGHCFAISRRQLFADAPAAAMSRRLTLSASFRR